MADHIELGKEGEVYAVQYLKDNGYQVLETNWRFSRAEIDIICKKEDLLIFVEVKTLSYTYYGDPESSVSERKEHLIIDAANQYMEAHDYEWAIRFDIISLVKEKDGTFKMKHFEDAFY